MCTDITLPRKKELTSLVRHVVEHGVPGTKDRIKYYDTSIHIRMNKDRVVTIFAWRAGNCCMSPLIRIHPNGSIEWLIDTMATRYILLDLGLIKSEFVKAPTPCWVYPGGLIIKRKPE